ncbi:MAG: DNA-binding LytR/AlgR family response regulator [Marivirga sp.]|jgi:DNA-binding LytR/AlgR family response regulator
MRVVIIEDEKPAQERLQKLIETLAPSYQVIAILDSVKSSVAWLEQNEHPDLFFMDIQLADGLSFSIFDKISTKKPIIFCTAYDEYALKAFKHNSVDYLLKPIDIKALEDALNKFKDVHTHSNAIDLSSIQRLLQMEKHDYKKRFMIKVGDRIKAVNVSDISFFWSEHKATYLQTFEKKRSIVDYTLDEVQNYLDPHHFFRLNRKYICTLDAIKHVFSYSNSRLKVALNNCDDTDILVSREKVKKFKEWLDA